MASVKVAVRVRPFNQREIEMDSTAIIKMEGKKTSILNSKLQQSSTDNDLGRERVKEFTYDYSYWSFDAEDPNYSSQEQVFDDIGKDVVDSAFEGYNACIFAYGQTGSGKTYTMMGTPDSEGLTPRICQALFARMKSDRSSGMTFRTEVSYLEIYNERVKDLLKKGAVQQNLRVREHPRLGPYVQDLSKHLVMDYSDIQELMNRGNTHRTTAATAMNETSSRSHAIFTLTFSQASFNRDMPSETVSKVNLVDLAGSERADATGATGQRLKEGGHINKSLVTLGSVISALADMATSSVKKQTFIPYRDSVLTWLLKDSLGGNSKTVMIATISPAECNYGETLSTLRYANRAKNILNMPTINEDPNVKLIRSLRSEICRLKSLLNDSTSVSSPTMIEKLQENEARVKVLTEEWTEKWKETHKILKEQRTLGLRKSGLGVVLDSELPHLVGIDDDLLSTGITLYHLKEGKTLIGTSNASVKQDIVLSGIGIEDEHCIVELKKGVAILIPLGKAQCYVNTILIDKPTCLSQGCVVLLGKTSVFRYNDPSEVERLRKEKERGSTLNLSRLSLWSRSMSDLARSVENLCPGISELEEVGATSEVGKLEKKRQELSELEDRHKLAKEHLKKEQQLAEEELDKKRQELIHLQNESDAVRRQVEEDSARSKEIIDKENALVKKLETLKSYEEDLVKEVTKTELELQHQKSSLQLQQDELQSQFEVQMKQLECLQNELEKLRQQAKEDHHQTLEIIAEKMPDAKEMDSSMESSSSFTERLRNLEQMLQKKWVNTDWQENSFGDLLSNEDGTDSSETNKSGFKLSKFIREKIQQVSLMEQTMKKIESDISEKLTQVEEKKNELMAYNDQIVSSETSTKENDRSTHNSQVQKEKNVEASNFTANDKATEDSSKERSAFKEPSLPQSSTSEQVTKHTSRSLQLHFEAGSSGGAVESRLSTPEDLWSANLAVSLNQCSGIDGTSLSGNMGQSLSLPDVKEHITLKESNQANSTLPPQDALAKIQHMQNIKQQFSEVREELDAARRNFEKFYVQGQDSDQLQKLQLQEREQQERISRLVEQEVQRRLLEEPAFHHHQQNPSQSRERHRRYLSESDVNQISEAHQNELWVLQQRQHSGWHHGSMTPNSNYSSRRSSCSHMMERDLSSPLLNMDSPIQIVIPSYAMRGTGTSAHYEFEVKIRVMSDVWTIYRRYKRFRELHQFMKQKYGSKVQLPYFPPRKIFGSRSEKVVVERKKYLEIYLCQLVKVCATISDCPLYPREGHVLCKQDMHEFAPFFRKGCFETSKHGTG